jgi:hypothetical protein
MNTCVSLFVPIKLRIKGRYKRRHIVVLKHTQTEIPLKRLDILPTFTAIYRFRLYK